MSHASTTVRLEDGTEWYGEYDGTVDVFMPQLFETKDERHAAWRNHDRTQICEATTLGCDIEIAEVENDYGAADGTNVSDRLVCRKHRRMAHLGTDYCPGCKEWSNGLVDHWDIETKAWDCPKPGTGFGWG